MESYILLLIMRVTQMLWTLKRLNHNYDSFTIESFFGSKLGRLLYSNLGLRTVRDLVNVEAVILLDAMLDLSELDGREFSEVFQALYEFFESY
jgi:hypothetical protein